MDKQKWLSEAINYIDSMDSKEFEDFVVGCAPYYKSFDVGYSELAFGRPSHISSDFARKASNMDVFNTSDISLAA